MIRKLVRLVRVVLALAGLAWLASWLVALLRDVRELLRSLEDGPRILEAARILEGVDPDTGERYGVRLTPLRPAEWARARALERELSREG